MPFYGISIHSTQHTYVFTSFSSAYTISDTAAIAWSMVTKNGVSNPSIKWTNYTCSADTRNTNEVYKFEKMHDTKTKENKSSTTMVWMAHIWQIIMKKLTMQNQLEPGSLNTHRPSIPNNKNDTDLGLFHTYGGFMPRAHSSPYVCVCVLCLCFLVFTRFRKFDCILICFTWWLANWMRSVVRNAVQCHSPVAPKWQFIAVHEINAN